VQKITLIQLQLNNGDRTE